MSSTLLIIPAADRKILIAMSGFGPYDNDFYL